MGVAVRKDWGETFSTPREITGLELMKMAEDGIDFACVFTDNAPAAEPVGKLYAAYPERCFNTGIAEANAVGMAAGLCFSGHKNVFAQVFGPFLPLRAADQLHTDIAYNDVPVKLIGTHCGLTSGGGPTHNVVTDLAFYRAIPNLAVAQPADGGQYARMLRASVNFPHPLILRIPRGPMHDVYASQDYPFEFGKAITLRDGGDLTLIGSGYSLFWAMDAALILEKSGINARVIDMHTVKPLDTEAVLGAARETKNIFTVEDHSVNGGLGGAVAELLAESGVSFRFKRFALPDEFAAIGDPDRVYSHYGLDGKGIAASVLKYLG